MEYAKFIGCVSVALTFFAFRWSVPPSEHFFPTPDDLRYHSERARTLQLMKNELLEVPQVPWVRLTWTLDPYRRHPYLSLAHQDRLEAELMGAKWFVLKRPQPDSVVWTVSAKPWTYEEMDRARGN